MKKMRRIVAMIAMLAVLMSSFVFAEEAVVAEIAEPVAAAAVEVPAEETAAEDTAEETIEVEAAAAEETAPAAVADDAATAAECNHIVICFEPGVCQLCRQKVDQEAQHPDNITDDAPILCPDQPNMHGYYCVLCNGFAYLEEHFTDCTFENPNLCAVCNAEIADEYVFHGGLQKEYTVVEGHSELHGQYCTSCKNYMNVGAHAVDCLSADLSKCDSCGAKVEGDAVQHNYVGGLCTKCNKGLSIDSLSVTAPAGNLGVGEKYALKMTVTPSNVIHTAEFKSSASGVASVDADGVITAKKTGSANITVTVTGPDGKAKSETVKVTVKKAPKSVSLNHSKLSIWVGEEGQLKASIGGSNYGSTLTWTSSNPSVAFVDATGYVVATGMGEAVITVSTFNGKTDTCTIMVTEAPTEIVVPVPEINMYYKQKLNLGAYLVDDHGNVCEGEIKYESDAPSNVSVSSAGVVTVKKATKGTATITLTAGDLYAEVLVNVCKEPSKVELDETEINLIRGETYQIEPIIGDDEAADFTYKSSKTAVASVDKQGLLTAKGEGSATITVSTHNRKSVKLKVNVEDPYKPDAVELSESGTYYLSLGEELELDVTLYPDTAESDLEWSSSKPKVATGEIIDGGCIITPLNEGTTKITVETYNGLTDSVSIVVVDPYKVAAVELEETGTVALALGEELQLNANVLPATAETELKWTTSSKNYATVDQDGLVTGLKVGSAKITVKSENGKSDTVTIKVYDPSEPYAVELDQEGTVTINIGEELQLNATVLPDTADTELKWSTSSKNYATVDQDGLVTPVKAGTATITVKTENGLKDTVKVKVTDKYKPTSIELAVPGAVTVGDTVEMPYSLEPANAMTKLQWKTSDADIATVDEDGFVTFHAQGSVTISVKTHNSKTDSLKITVGAAILPDSITATVAANGMIGVGEQVSIITAMTPSNAKSELSYISSNPAVASVDAKGVVHGMKEGEAIITVSTKNGKTASVKITVTASSAGVELSGSSFSGLASVMGGLKKIEKNGVIYYTDATGSGAVMINRGSQDIRDSVVSIELAAKSSYRVYGVGVGMTMKDAVAALIASGASVEYQGADAIMAVGSGAFAIVEVVVNNGIVSYVTAYAA